jgi:hypothetical protein
MSAHKKAACELGSDVAAYQDFNANDTAPQPVPRKWQRILAAMLDGKPRNTIEHGRELHTTCLHSDVSDLESRGLLFHRERITVAAYGGEKACVVRYSLLPESYPIARALLGMATP